jgi:hypothetical protein
MAKPNHGSSVSAAAKAAQDARTDDGPQGIGPQVREVARNKDQSPPEPDYTDGVITVVKDEGGTQVFDTFADALAFSNDGDTLQVGQGTYAEAFELDESVTIVAEDGAVLDGSGIIANATGSTSTIEVYDGFSGGSISGLNVVAVQNGSAVETIIGQDVNDVTLEDNIFDGGDNTAGSVVYLNPGADRFVFDSNSFQGAKLTGSPLLGIEGDTVTVSNNVFGDVAGDYPKVEVFDGPNGMTDDVVFTNNTGLNNGDLFIA